MGYRERTEVEKAGKEGGRKMRKGMVLFFILSLGVPTLTHAQSAKDALMGLKKLQARTQAGISYKDYGNALGEAKFPLNMFLESKDAQKYPELSTSLRKVMAHYDYAGICWKIKMVVEYGEFIDVNSDIGKNIERLYPNANKDAKEGGAIFKDKNYSVTFLLPLIWGEASIELDNATKLYAKSEEKQSDDTVKLKEEIAKLKKEVARLKKENDLLKNPQKVK